MPVKGDFLAREPYVSTLPVGAYVLTQGSC